MIKLLKKQTLEFINIYEKFFLRSLGCAFFYTIFCFVSVAILLKYSEFNSLVKIKQSSLLSYFYSRYSYGETYSLVDLSKTIFIFFVSFFSLSMLRLSSDTKITKEWKVGDFLGLISWKDFLYLLGILVFCSLLDFGIFKLGSLMYLNIENHNAYHYLQSILFLLRIYLPLIIFGLTVSWIYGSLNVNINLKIIMYNLVALWLFNEFGYELFILVSGQIFGLILIPFVAEKQFFIESFLGMILMAAYFLGYHSAMTYTFIHAEDFGKQ